MSKKTYITRDEFGRGTCHIIHAETRGKAKYQAAGILGIEFLEARVERAPEFDRYDGKPSPKQLIENHGWWYGCDECRRQTYQENVARYTDRGYPVCVGCEEVEGE